jgi:hypothetical protein
MVVSGTVLRQRRMEWAGELKRKILPAGAMVPARPRESLEAKDILRSFDSLETRPDIRRDCIGISGFQLGCRDAGVDGVDLTN